MRFWFSVPFIRRTRIGISGSDREIARAFTPKPLTKAELEKRAIEEAVLDAKAKAVADKWTPFIVDLILIAAIAAVVVAIWEVVTWLF